MFLAAKRDVFIATGEKTYSGTGRNQRTTRVVTQISNYQTLPLDVTVTNAAGSSIKLTDAGARWLAPYWTAFGSSAGYKVQVAVGSSSRLSVWLATKGANLAVGGVVAVKSSGGGLILLPDLDFEQPEFVEEVDGEAVWSDAAQQFAARLVSSLVTVDKQWRAEAETSPEPAWARLPTYALLGEQRLQSELLRAERLAEEARARVDGLKDELASAGLTCPL